MKFKAKVVEVAELGEYQGTKYSSVRLRSTEIGNNTILRYKLDLETVKHAEIEKMLDKDIVATVSAVKGQGDLATLKLTAFQPVA